MISTNRVITRLFKRYISYEGSTDILKQIQLNNGYKLFNLEQKYRIDTSKLQHEMQTLQKKLHPDKFVNCDSTTRTKSEYLSSKVNEFYSILKDPYKRGKYLLCLITNSDSSKIEDNLERYKVDQDFLFRMMELREKIENSESENSKELNILFTELDSELLEVTNKLDIEFDHYNIENIYKLLSKLKFLVTCHHALAERLGLFSRY